LYVIHFGGQQIPVGLTIRQTADSCTVCLKFRKTADSVDSGPLNVLQLGRQAIPVCVTFRSTAGLLCAYIQDENCIFACLESKCTAKTQYRNTRTAKTQYLKFETNIRRKGIARP
jgi:hypothetical protein